MADPVIEAIEASFWGREGPDARAVLAALRSELVLGVLVERAAKALWTSQGGAPGHYDRHWQTVVHRHASAAILAALTPDEGGTDGDVQDR